MLQPEVLSKKIRRSPSVPAPFDPGASEVPDDSGPVDVHAPVAHACVVEDHTTAVDPTIYATSTVFTPEITPDIATDLVPVDSLVLVNILGPVLGIDPALIPDLAHAAGAALVDAKAPTILAPVYDQVDAIDTALVTAPPYDSTVCDVPTFGVVNSIFVWMKLAEA